VDEFFSHVCTIRYRAALMIAYGAGLRVSEVVALQKIWATSIPNAMLIGCGKAKARRTAIAMLSPRLLVDAALLVAFSTSHPPGRRHISSPEDWLFPGFRKRPPHE